jgi:hypothetical protein
MGQELEAEALTAQKKSVLPEAVDFSAVTKLVTDVYMDFWQR